MRYTSGDPILADCDYHHQLDRVVDPEYKAGAINAWHLAQQLYQHPDDPTAVNLWNSALELARSTKSRRYSLGWLHAAYVARINLNT